MGSYLILCLLSYNMGQKNCVKNNSQVSNYLLIYNYVVDTRNLRALLVLLFFNASIAFSTKTLFNGDCTKQGYHFATGTIAEGETKHGVINNGFTVESINTFD